MDSIGDRVRGLREEKGLSLMDLCRVTGLPRQTVVGIETGKSIPSGRTAMIIADAFGATLDYIFTGRTCKGCIWYEAEEEWCRNMSVLMYENDFCTYWQRKEDTE